MRGILGFVAVAALATACDGGMMNPDVDASMSMPDSADTGQGPTAQQLRDVLAMCMVIGGPYAADSGGTANINVCGLSGAVWWTSDLDVDCDGKMSTKCNLQADPAYQNQTAASDSHGDPLDAAALPYVVVPGKSIRWDYTMSGLKMGSLFVVIYKDSVQYGVAGDVGPTSIIGEASYRMAELLGIDPDPSTGGTDEPVTYIGFTGTTAVVSPIEDHDRAVSLGIEKARALVGL